MFTYKATVIGIVDGDTVDFNIDLGFETFRKIRVRLYGINTPELHIADQVEAALAAKKYVEEALPTGKVIYITTFKDKTEKYGRYLANIYTDEQLTEPSLNKQLVTQGLAVEYFGGKK